VFLDATVIRSIIVPASMRLLGNVNWYLPRWLQWLPELQVEGHRVITLPDAIPTQRAPAEDQSEVRS
jgi:RND superfamily putative drug exporter